MKRVWKKWISLTLAAALTVGLCMIPAAADAPEFAGGEGTEAAPYVIENAEQLKAVANHLNAYFVLNADIALTGENWTPLGSGVRSGNKLADGAAPFTGSFDGGGHTVSGLKISSTDSADAAVGLFGAVSGGAVSNVKLTGVEINVPDSELVGAVCGVLLENGLVEDCEVSGVMTVGDGGGIAGRILASGTISGCSNHASVTSGNGKAAVAGIVSKAYYTEPGKEMNIIGCSNDGAISGVYCAGGIAGLSAANVADNTNSGAVTASGNEAGGIVGEQTNWGTLSGNTNAANVTAGEIAGGIVGWVRYQKNASYTNNAPVVIQNNQNSGAIAATGDAGLGSGGIVGNIYNAAVVTGNENRGASIKGGTFAAGVVGALQASNENCFYDERAVEVRDNVSTTDRAQITAKCTDLYAYNNDSVKFVVRDNGGAWAAGIGENRYTSLSSALSAAKTGETVTLLQNVDLSAAENLTIDKNITIARANAGKAWDAEDRGEETVITVYAGQDKGNEGGRIVIADGAEVTFDGVSLEATYAADVAAPMICTRGTAQLSLLNSKVANQGTRFASGYGLINTMAATQGGRLTIHNSKLIGMLGSEEGAAPATYYILGGGGTVELDVTDNCFENGRWALFETAASGTFSRNILARNAEALTGGVINSTNLKGLIIEGNVFKSNLSGTRFVIGGSYTIRDNLFEDLKNDLALYICTEGAAEITGNTFEMGEGSYGIRLVGKDSVSWCQNGDASKVHVTGNHFTGQGVCAIRNNDGWTGSVRAEKNYYGGGPLRTDYVYEGKTYEIGEVTAQPYLIKVTLDTAGGATESETTLYADTENGITLPSAAQSGYSFLGWSDGVTTHPAGAVFKGAADVTLTAGWQSNYVPPSTPSKPSTDTQTKTEGDTTTTTTTTTTKNPDGSITTGTTETAVNSSTGEKTETKVTETVAKDGSVTKEEVKSSTAADGTKTEEKNVSISDKATGTSTTAQVVTDGNGRCTAAAVTETRTEAAVKDGAATAAVDAKTADKLVEQAKAAAKAAAGADSVKAEVVIAAQVPAGQDVTSAAVELPKSAVGALAGETAADVTVSTPVAEVTLPNAALAQLADQPGKTVAVRAGRTADGAVTVAVTVDGAAAENLPGGLKASIPVEKAAPGIVAVLVRPDGSEELIRKTVMAGGAALMPLDGCATVKLVDNSRRFEDTAQAGWAAEAMTFVAARELFQGVSETSFAPSLPMNRGMLVTVLSRLENEPEGTKAGSFADVPGDAYFAGAVDWAAGQGIVTGTGDGFAPDANVTREQLAVFLCRYLKAVGVETGTASGGIGGYADGAAVSNWARESMEWAVGAGIITGRDSGALDPAGTATRAEVAVMLQRLVEYMA